MKNDGSRIFSWPGRISEETTNQANAQRLKRGIITIAIKYLCAYTATEWYEQIKKAAEEEEVDAPPVVEAVEEEEETVATAVVAAAAAAVEVPPSVPIKDRPVGPENVIRMVAIKDVVVVVEEEEEEEDADQEGGVEEEDVVVVAEAAAVIVVKSKNQPRQKS